MDPAMMSLLAKEYPDAEAVSTEIINLNAICCLPKGTEYFFSDPHGEAEAFCHLLNTASGVIRDKIEGLFSRSVSLAQREELSQIMSNLDKEMFRLNQQKEKNANHPIYRIFKTRTNTIRKHQERGKISEELRKAAIALCEELRDKALLDTEFAQEEYPKRMEQEAVYAEARRRLGGDGSCDQ